jgi:hypothetical protein
LPEGATGAIPSARNSRLGLVISPSPLACRISTSAEKSHPLNSVAPPATILNDVLTFSVGGAFLKLHCLFAYNAAQETYQRAFIVVQMMSPGHLHRLISPSVPIERTFTFVGEHGNLIAHFDESHFDQCPEIVRTDRHKFGSLAFDITQHPAEMDRRV